MRSRGQAVKPQRDLDAICGSPTASSTARCSLTVRSPCCTVSPGERYSRRSPAPPSRTLPSAKGLSRGRRLPDDLRGGSNSSRSGALRPALTTGLSQSEPLRPLDYLRSGAATGAPAGRRRAPASSNERDPGQRAAQTRFATKPPGDRGRTICCIRAAASARGLQLCRAASTSRRKQRVLASSSALPVRNGGRSRPEPSDAAGPGSRSATRTELGDRAAVRLPGRVAGGEQIEVRVECAGRVREAVGGVLAEAFDRLGHVRGEGGQGAGGDRLAFPVELAQDGGHVERGVEDDAVGEQRVDLDDLLLFGGVIALDRVGPEPQPGRERVVRLDLVRAAVISSRSSGSEMNRSSVIVRITLPSWRNALYTRCSCATRSRAAGARLSAARVRP